MVLGEHRYEVGEPVVSGEAGEQGDADVHHTLDLRDHNRASPEPRQPMPLAGVVPLDAVCLLLARVQLPGGQQHLVNRIVIRAVQAGAPARQARDQALTGGLVTTPASQSTSWPEARSQAFQTQRGSDFFLDSATSRRARSPRPGPPARASARRRPQTAPARPGWWAWRRPATWRCGSSTNR